MVGQAAFLLLPRLRRTGRRNLELAFPEMPATERGRTLRKLYRNLGWLLAEFCLMQRYTPEKTKGFLRYEGLEHFLAAREEGRGCSS